MRLAHYADTVCADANCFALLGRVQGSHPARRRWMTMATLGGDDDDDDDDDDHGRRR